jgi:ABC-type transport system involved in cytochrome c biogenesis permease subunit
MKKGKMWLAAIVINILTCIIYWILNPKADGHLDLRGLFLFLFLTALNFILGFSIAAYSAFKGKDIEGQPFFALFMVLLLISWGVCHL